jgi:hypothetical protein
MKADRFFVGRPFKFGVDQQKYKFFARSALAFIVNVITSQRITDATSKQWSICNYKGQEGEFAIPASHFNISVTKAHRQEHNFRCCVLVNRVTKQNVC